ncbi:MAG: DEAD/DEAH box helicase [Acidimicrobiia bacterium]|nr:DEAD/DEAH box helicase [Acidimicrobiia bacterium]
MNGVGVSLHEPPRPTSAEVLVELAEHVRLLAGPGAVPRPEQAAAVQAVVAGRQRTLLVARTGFGKSAVYFSATKMLRDRGWGPTVVVSPLLALMRDQVAAASRLGLTAETLNSSNLDDWPDIEQRIAEGRVDLLLVAPERLANPGFQQRVFRFLRSQAFALVCDEAHCISDWGHDFRPDYRRLRRLLDELPAWTPVLATTATANGRVTDDVAGQLGADTVVLRTSLDRESLHLSVVDLPSDAERLAWLADNLAALPGSGIVYCLTVEQASTAAAFLAARGHEVEAYSGAVDPDRRLQLEDALAANRLKALVATSALGMGFDKGDLAFCVHLGLPPSPVSYYQQIGRAGRALARAEVIALPRPVEDAAVWRWFESVSLPAESVCRTALNQLDPDRPTSLTALESAVNLGRSRLGILMSILEVDGAVARAGGGWVRTSLDWRYDHELVAALTELRRAEAAQMSAWANLAGCRLRFLRDALDDRDAADCGRCDNCLGTPPPPGPHPATVAEAHRHLRGGDVVVEPRKQWPSGLGEPKGRIPADRQAAPGRALARLGDGGWDPVVASLLDSSAGAAGSGSEAAIDDELLARVAEVLKRWPWDERPTWICPVPSRRHAGLIEALAEGLGRVGRLPVHRAVRREGDGGFQADQSNSAHQCANVWGHLVVDPSRLPEAPTARGPVLVVDDEADSRWTLTVAAHLLRGAGSGAVLPFVLRTR